MSTCRGFISYDMRISAQFPPLPDIDSYQLDISHRIVTPTGNRLSIKDTDRQGYLESGQSRVIFNPKDFRDLRPAINFFSASQISQRIYHPLLVDTTHSVE
jgi:hypothetical protein